MSASFYTLFRRSRYSGLGPSADRDKATMEQKERFAGGMIGLGLKVDPQFRRHFLTSICGLKGLAEAQGWEILVEPEYWGDLVLRHAASRTQFVIEIKIDCELKAHQDPSKREFYSEEGDGCSGYGWEIPRWAKRAGFSDLRYATIQRVARWVRPFRNDGPVLCTPHEWRHLLRTASSAETPMEEEIYDCLGYLGVEALLARRMRNMKLGSDATKPIALLAGVLNKFKGEYKQRWLEADSKGLGLNLTGDLFPVIAAMTQAGSDTIIGWFGYEADPPRGPRLSLWWYFAKDLPENVRRRAHDLVRKRLRAAGFAEERFQIDDANVGVFCKAQESQGDQEWFESAMSAFQSNH